MKKIYSLLFLFIGITGFALEPPVVGNLAPLSVCDDNNDGMTAFNLTSIIPGILGPLGPGYSVSFHETMTDAEVMGNTIPNPANFVNIVPFTQVIYVRVNNDETDEYTIVQLELIVGGLPTASIISQTVFCQGNDVAVVFQGANGTAPYTFLYTINGGALLNIVSDFNGIASVSIPSTTEGEFVINLLSVIASGSANCSQELNEIAEIQILATPNPIEPIDLFVEDVPFDGTAIFDLTSNTPLLQNNEPNAIVSYHLNDNDARHGLSPIVPAVNFLGTNGQTIWAGVHYDGLEECTVVRSFTLYVTNPDIVFIPDANFKAKLLSLNVSTNNDGEIQFSEAANITNLNVNSSGITDFTGLEAFTNLEVLFMSSNSVSTVDLSQLTLLQVHVAINCGLTSLDYSNQPNLRVVDCSSNNLTSLDFSANPLMDEIICPNNQLTILNINGLSQLRELNVEENRLNTINTTGLQSIVNLRAARNLMTSLNLTGLETLSYLDCEFNQIDSIDTADCPNLTYLNVDVNQMTYLDVSQSPLLESLNCIANRLVNLDLSQNTALCTLNCLENPTMSYLNIKNGVDTCFANYQVLGITPNELFFCCDDNEVNYFKSYFLANNEDNVNVNSYCSFTPGGNYNTITVQTQFDADNDGCDVDDTRLHNIRINTHDGTNSGARFTDANGETFFYTQAGNFTLTPVLENPTWFTISPTSAVIPFANTNNNSVNQGFCIARNGVHPDLEIVIAPTSSARPGFEAHYIITVKNKGTQTMWQSNGINLIYESEKMEFIESSEIPSGNDGNSISWNLNDLAPLESTSIALTMRINTPTETEFTPVNNGDILVYNVRVFPNQEETPSDNTFQFNQTVVGSYDPNEIVCLEGNIVSPIEIGNYLHYIINFENTGTAAAENIVVKDVIDATQFDVGSLQLLGSSASVTTRLTANVAEFIFPSINLHSGGHGNILLKIKSRSNLVEGSTVTKTANIYFDYNFPIETDPENTVFQSLNNPEIPVDASISVYPNPTKGNLNIQCNNSIKSVQLFDMQGRILQTNLVNENQTNLDMSNKSSGVYFVRIISEKGMKVEKIVKE